MSNTALKQVGVGVVGILGAAAVMIASELAISFTVTEQDMEDYREGRYGIIMLLGLLA